MEIDWESLKSSLCFEWFSGVRRSMWNCNVVMTGLVLFSLVSDSEYFLVQSGESVEVWIVIAYTPRNRYLRLENVYFVYVKNARIYLYWNALYVRNRLATFLLPLVIEFANQNVIKIKFKFKFREVFATSILMHYKFSVLFIHSSILMTTLPIAFLCTNI